MNQLRFRVRQVTAIDETGVPIPFVGEPGSDDIYLAAVVLNIAKGTVTKIDPIRVGEFDDGVVKVFDPPRALVRFDLSHGKFPSEYYVQLVLIERDSGKDIQTYLDGLLDGIKAGLEKADATGDVDSDSGSWKDLLREAAEAAKDLIVETRKDDIFDAQTIKLKVPRKGHLFVRKAFPLLTPRFSDVSPTLTAVYREQHNAHYEVQYDWQILWPESVLSPGEIKNGQ